MTNNLDELLLAMLGTKDLVDTWWQSPNHAFGYMTPQQAFDCELTRSHVVAYIYRHSGYWV